MECIGRLFELDDFYQLKNSEDSIGYWLEVQSIHEKLGELSVSENVEIASYASHIYEKNFAEYYAALEEGGKE